jgi:NADH-quinone oxidoreductase subunit N
VISLFYYLRVIGPMYFETSTAATPLLGRWSALSAAITSAGVILVGVLAQLALGRLDAANFLP